MRNYQGKKIWIIGASSGIGKALAIELASQGAILALSARRSDQLEQVRGQCDGDQHLSIPLDIADYQATSQAFDTIIQQWETIDSVIFMAAIYTPHDGADKDIAFTHKALNVNLGGAYNTLYAVTKHMRQQQYGQIALCGSVAGYRGLPMGQPYCSTKAAIISLCETMRVDLSPYNIDVKVINPGFVKTPLTDKNDFPMPMMVSAEKAAMHIAKDLLKPRKFEIHFPKGFTFLMRILRILPNALYFGLMKKISQSI